MGKAKSAIESQKKAVKIALEFVKEVSVKLEKHGFVLRGAYVVGSRARGDYTEESDIDIVLIVDGVETMNTLERLNLVKDLLKPRLEVMVYSPGEWCGETSVWIRELKKEARPLPSLALEEEKYKKQDFREN